MIRKYNNISLVLGIPGLVLQVVGRLMGQLPVLLLGTVLLLLGLAFYAMAKGRHPAWCILAFLSLIGLIIMGCLKDLAPSRRYAATGRNRMRDLGITVLIAAVLLMVAYILVSSTFTSPLGQQGPGTAGPQGRLPSMPQPRHDAEPDGPPAGSRAGDASNVAHSSLPDQIFSRPSANPAAERDPHVDVPAETTPRPQLQTLNFHTWTNSTGAFRVEAQLLAYGGGKVMLKKESGQIKTVPLDLLSQSDRDYVASAMPKSGSPTDTEPVGGTGGMVFRSEGQGPLLGIKYSTGEWDNERSLREVEGVFDRPGGEDSVVAREGYAVGALNVDAERFVNAVQIVFMRIGSDGRLDPSDSYTSEWLGSRTKKPSATLGGTGAIILGIHGRGAAVVDAIGLIVRGR